MKNEVQKVFKSEIGLLYLVASAEGLTRVYWKNPKRPETGDRRALQILNQAAKQFGEYLDGRRKKFEIPLNFEGTPFQRNVWKELRKIPYGGTCSYAELAARVQKPKAVRAVGAANGRNPFSVIVPCHRVVSSSGKLQGYSGGLEVKIRLLELEKRHI